MLDPQGQAVCKTLGRLGFEEVRDVRVGKYVEVMLEEQEETRACERVSEMCRRLIANTVIEDFSIESISKGHA